MIKPKNSGGQLCRSVEGGSAMAYVCTRCGNRKWNEMAREEFGGKQMRGDVACTLL